MTEDEYIKTQDELMQLGNRIAQLDLSGMLRTLSFAETVGPIRDPVTFRKMAPRVAALKLLVQTFTPAQEASRRLLQLVLSEIHQ